MQGGGSQLPSDSGPSLIPQEPKADLPPVNLPSSGRPPVEPKPGRPIPGTEDIFADTEPAKTSLAASRPIAMPRPARPTEGVRPQRPSVLPEPLSQLPDDLDEESHGSRKFFWIGVVVLIIILGAGGWFAYSQFYRPDPLINSLPQVNVNSSANLNQQLPDVNLNLNRNLNQATEEEAVEPEPVVEEDEFLDSDKDGLTDAEEETYGTDPGEPDSDGDELFDREEVLVYGTDPLDPDTDGDGYLDGNEVKNGYDPVRPGSARLLDLNFEE